MDTYRFNPSVLHSKQSSPFYRCNPTFSNQGNAVASLHIDHSTSQTAVQVKANNKSLLKVKKNSHH